jgi:hypothetical protein
MKDLTADELTNQFETFMKNFKKELEDKDTNFLIFMHSILTSELINRGISIGTNAGEIKKIIKNKEEENKTSYIG